MSGIFISYRRSDNPDATGRIYDRLVAGFGKARVFKDVDSIPLGQDFRGHLSGIVGECGVVLAIIGPNWLDVRNKEAQRRLDDPDDFVRIELEAALARGIPVVPVLVGHASIPGASELPPSLAPMAFRQSIEVRPDPDFHNDATRLVAALRGILDPAAAAAEQAAATIKPPAAATTTRSPTRLGWIVAVVLLGITAALLATPAIRYLRRVPPPETRLDIVTPTSDDPTSFALSPDGRQIVFVAAGEDGISRLWLRPLSATNAQPLAGTEDARLPFWSPDSRSVGFFANGELQRLDLGGGAPRPLAAVGYGMGGAWNADGVILFAPALGAPLLRVPATGGSAVAATKLAAKQVAQGVPVFLPDGRHFLFSAAGSSADTTGIYLATLGTTDVQRLTAAESSSAYLPSGWLLWVQPGGDLVAQRLDLKRHRLTDDPVTIADGVANARADDAFSVSATGLVAYRTGPDAGGMRLAPRLGGGNLRRQLTWFDRTGKPREVLGDPDQTIGYPSLSPDGQRAAVQRTVQGNTDIWLIDDARTSRLTFDPAVDIYPVWSPDGRSVVFSSFRDGFSDLYRKAVDGSGTDALLVTSSQIKVPTDLSRDGRYLLYFSIDPQTKADLWVRPMTGDQKPWPFLKTPFDEKYGQFSPDGRFVAYQSDESGRYEIYLRPFTPPGKATSASGGQWQISTDGGIQPRWSPDGRELYYLDRNGRMMAASVMASATPGKPVVLFPTRILGGGVEAQQGFQYAVARDGRFLVDTVLGESKSPSPIRLIQNWQPPPVK